MPSQLKKSTESRTQSLADLREKFRESTAPKSFRQDDDRYWKLEVDKTGTGSAIIRFLPGRENDPAPYATLHTHGFQGPSGKWYIENCPTSIALECPACKANSELWNSGREEDKKLASSRKRRLSYVSDILVLKDAKHPENDGKVFLYKYGKKVFEKIKDLLMPPDAFADMEPVNAFCPYDGANFKLRVTKQDGFPNYDKSTFDAPSPLFNGNEDTIMALEEKQHSLADVVGAGQFKSYDDLNKHLILVLGAIPTSGNASAQKSAIEEDVVDTPRAAPVRAAKPQATAKPKATAVASSPMDDDDDDYFAKLAQGGSK